MFVKQLAIWVHICSRVFHPIMSCFIDKIRLISYNFKKQSLPNLKNKKMGIVRRRWNARFLHSFESSIAL